MNSAGPTGRDVVQLYVSGAGFLNDPIRQLKGFSPTGLISPQDSVTITFTLSINNLRYWDESKDDWASYLPGKYSLWVGSSSRDLRLSGSVTVEM